MMTDSETLAAILAELQAMRHELTNKPARVFIPEDVRRALDADRVILSPDGNLWRLTVWFGQLPSLGGIDSTSYCAISSEGFTTEEAIEAIQRQRPTVPA